MVEHNRLVVDIGGGSTECIIGQKLKPRTVESLYMGCVSYTSRFFPGGKIDKKAMKNAELAAREQVQTIADRFEKLGWKEAVGSSGTARSLAEVMMKNRVSEGGITAAGLEWLREELLSAGEFKKLAFAGLREDRVPVIAGGVAIMSAVFAELDLEEMKVAEGALRDGVLWDLLGRVHHRDIREVTVDQFMQTYHVDAAQAQRVRDLSLQLLKDIAPDASEQATTFLDWASRLHEVGVSIAQAAYHKHSAYILAFADMPGFSRQEQGYLSNLVLAQRGKISKMREAFDDDPRLATLAFCLRVAVIVYRSRRPLQQLRLRAEARGNGYRLRVARDWLEDHTLVWHALDEEREEWISVGLELELEET
jgi:exopolyphosphatase/guanosine-5'-triphosphate,3'-diphosphate pyrophosphatase